MSTHLRAWFTLVALLSPSLVVNPRAVTDWRPVITAPSIWDWCPQCAFVPNLGTYRIAKRGE